MECRLDPERPNHLRSPAKFVWRTCQHVDAKSRWHRHPAQPHGLSTSLPDLNLSLQPLGLQALR